LVIALLPTVIVFWANACFVHNHFYVEGPYILDSGWFSKLVYRSGWFLKNPDIMYSVPYYYGWHVTPLLSLGSLLSYGVPLPRVEYYCLFQGLIYAPLAAAPPLLVPREQRASIATAVGAATCGLLFAFGGQVLKCVAYPHFEIFAAVGVAFMLAGLATSRTRLAWAGIVMAAITREDGAFHASLFLLAVLVSGRLGRPFPVAQRTLRNMFFAAFGAGVFAFLFQRFFFVRPPAFEMYLVGKPPYAHVNASLVAQRAAFFVRECGFIHGPFFVTLAFAIARRDPRYLLGWVAEIPWLLLNFFAKQDAKSEFSVYTGFPFVGCVFWIAAYGRAVDRSVWRSLATTAVASVLSAFAARGVTEHVLRNSLRPLTTNPAGVRAFASAVAAAPPGSIWMDGGFASWAVESPNRSPFDTVPFASAGKLGGDGIAFFSSNYEAVGATIIQSGFRHCWRQPSTPLFYCAREPKPLLPELVPANPIVAELRLTGVAVRRDREYVVVDATPTVALSLFGPYVRLVPARYRATWTFDMDRCPPASLARMRFDVAGDGGHVIAAVDVVADAKSVALDFELSAQTSIELRTYSGSCAFLLRTVDLQLLEAPASP
jgi:hypothetical protein